MISSPESKQHSSKSLSKISTRMLCQQKNTERFLALPTDLVLEYTINADAVSQK